MSYEAIWEEKGIYWKYKGILTSDDLLQSNISIYGDSRFDKLRYQLLDMLDVESFDVDTEAMEEVTVMDVGASQTNPRLIVAVVATHVQAKRLVELYENTTGSAPWETDLFESVEEARVWITSKFGIAFE
jgi:hypothetical protein